MHKFFLSVLFFTKVNMLFGMGLGTELFRALRWNSSDFTVLTKEQDSLYFAQINHGNRVYETSSLETAIIHGSVTGTNWLLSKGVKLRGTELRYALTNATPNVEIVNALLKQGASTRTIIDDGKDARVYMRAKFAAKLDFYAANPIMRDEIQLKALEHTAKLLNEHS